MRNKWTREETILAFELYCTLPKGQDKIDNPAIVALSAKTGRTPSSIRMKLQNFKSCDPSYTHDGKVGLSNASKLDWEISNEFFQRWDDLIVEANDIKQVLGLQKSDKNPAGKDRYALRKVREGQAFFRAALLAAYDGRCCFTGIAVPDLLKASHIKPWAKANDVNEKANPRNGLLLNALHDAAFDKGYITITYDYTILVADSLLEQDENRVHFEPINGKMMTLPSKFSPDRQFIEYHHGIFRGNAT